MASDGEKTPESGESGNQDPLMGDAEAVSKLLLWPGTDSGRGEWPRE
jgi:hypothetical protein